jgi:hypothetical protein
MRYQALGDDDLREQTKQPLAEQATKLSRYWFRRNIREEKDKKMI